MHTVTVSSHTRKKPYSDRKAAKCQQLREEVRVEEAMAEWASWFPAYYIRCWRWRQ